ncbi:MAG: CBS domain-containing protein [Polyangiaceae bacterium]
MKDFLDTPIADIMTTRIEMVSDTIPLSFAAKLLVDKQITGLPVTTELGELVGVLSWADVMRALGDEAGDAAEGKGSYYSEGETMVFDGRTRLDDVEAKVGDYMSDLIIAVGVDATVRDAVRLMKKGAVHRVLVVDDQGNLAGLVSATDIVYLVADAIEG